MKAVIIGCGYVGSAAALIWKEAGYAVTATTRNPERKTELLQVATNVYMIPQNVSLDFHEVLAGANIVLLAMAAGKQGDYKKTYLDNAQAVVNALKGNSSVRQVIYTSSTSVYGEHDGAWVDEETPLQPLNENTALLAETEKSLLSLPFACILRLGEIYGPGREIAERLRRMANRPFPGTGNNYTNLIHIEDIAKCIQFAQCHNLKGVFNLVNDVHVTRKELYDELCKTHGVPAIQWDPSLQSPHGGNKRVTNAKIKGHGFKIACNIV